mmetsp:Transcript_113565/g.260642  ORF Transcript_113565/g.260642 Transcript_113565/m.260642 type:complete len:217 (-) Transcript_113565:2893-3543(-)
MIHSSSRRESIVAGRPHRHRDYQPCWAPLLRTSVHAWGHKLQRSRCTSEPVLPLEPTVDLPAQPRLRRSGGKIHRGSNIYCGSTHRHGQRCARGALRDAPGNIVGEHPEGTLQLQRAGVEWVHLGALAGAYGRATPRHLLQRAQDHRGPADGDAGSIRSQARGRGAPGVARGEQAETTGNEHIPGEFVVDGAASHRGRFSCGHRSAGVPGLALVQQ